MIDLSSAKADEDKYLIEMKENAIKLKEFHSKNAIKYRNHDKLESQLKMFFGFDPENPETSFYPDSLITDYSNYIRDMYKLKLNDLTIKK